MDIANHSGLRQSKQVAVIQQILSGILEALTTDIGFLHSVGADRRSHGSIDDGDSVLEDLFERMAICRHIYV